MRYWTKRGKGSLLQSYDEIRTFVMEHEDKETIRKLNYAVGYEILGPILLGFSDFLAREITKEGIEKVFFLSRDGWIMKKAFELLYPEYKKNCSYIHVSRHSVTIPLLSKAKNYDEMMEILIDFFFDPIIGRLGELCGIENTEFLALLGELGYTKDTDITAIRAADKEKIYKFIYGKRGSFFEQQERLLRSYLDNKGFKGKVAVVDVGWNGSIQHALGRFLESGYADIRGYYLGVRNTRNNDFYANDYRKGFLFEPHSNYKYRQMIRFTVELTDIMFVAPNEGSTYAYAETEDGSVGYVTDNKCYDGDGRRFIYGMHKYAMKFVDDVYNNKRRITVDADIIMQVYEKFAARPDSATMRGMGGITFYDGSIRKKLLSDRSVWYYMLHLNEFYRDFNMNKCKIWFLKDILKMPLPYYHILDLMDRMGAKSELQKKVAGGA